MGILAAAGVKRLGWEKRISSYLHQDVCLHAVGQGALAIECRKQDWYMINIAHSLIHLPTLISCVAERAVMRKLEGGCSAPVACHAEIIEDMSEVNTGDWQGEGHKIRLSVIA